MRIAVDAMGGDHAPGEIVSGCRQFAERSGTEVLLVGPSHVLEPLVPSGNGNGRLRIYEAPDAVGMDESPAKALRRPEASVAVAVGLVRDGEADAVVSAGNSGAFMAWAWKGLGTVPGLDRPAIAILVPTLAGPRILLDAGANADCRPANLVEWGVLGSVYAEAVLGLHEPRVGLLNIGSEAGKGNELVRSAFRALQELGDTIHFVGNVEGADVFAGRVDVTLCDGFTGNVVLKVAEGVSELLLGEVKREMRRRPLAVVGGLLASGALRAMRRRFDKAEYGGAMLVGVRGVCIVGHGHSNARAICNAIAVGERAVRADLVSRLGQSLAEPAAVEA